VSIQGVALVITILIGLTAINVLLCGYSLFVIIRFERLLKNASSGAADHFEKLRKVRQMGV
jgi:hypothetical protein